MLTIIVWRLTRKTILLLFVAKRAKTETKARERKRCCARVKERVPVIIWAQRERDDSLFCLIVVVEFKEETSLLFFMEQRKHYYRKRERKRVRYMSSKTKVKCGAAILFAKVYVVHYPWRIVCLSVTRVVEAVHEIMLFVYDEFLLLVWWWKRMNFEWGPRCDDATRERCYEMTSACTTYMRSLTNIMFEWWMRATMSVHMRRKRWRMSTRVPKKEKVRARPRRARRAICAQTTRKICETSAQKPFQRFNDARKKRCWERVERCARCARKRKRERRSRGATKSLWKICGYAGENLRTCSFSAWRYVHLWCWEQESSCMKMLFYYYYGANVFKENAIYFERENAIFVVVVIKRAYYVVLEFCFCFNCFMFLRYYMPYG